MLRSAKAAFAVDEPFPITPDVRERFRRDGFIKIKDVVPADSLARIEPAITALVEERERAFPSLSQPGFYSKQFAQVTAAWRTSEAVREFTFSKRFARMAAELMGVPSVRLYHDQALFKLPGGSRTLHHQDLSYWPLATARACAMWIPLQRVPLDMGALEFYRGSHELPYKSLDVITPEGERKMLDRLHEAGCVAYTEAYELGEVSFHLGWTCHAAGANTTDRIRKAHSINFFEDGTRLGEPTANQTGDRNKYLHAFEPGDVIDDAEHPVLWRSG